MPPSDSLLKLTMSPCLRLTSSTQSFGRETMSVEYPTFWTFRASIMRDMMNILYTNRMKNGEYILEPQRMISLYVLRGPMARRCSISHLHFPKASWELWGQVARAGFSVDSSDWVIRRGLKSCGVDRECKCP